MSSLKILEVKKKDKPTTNVNPILPSHPFLWSICAGPVSGKSNMICNLLLNENFYYCEKKEPYSHFEEIIYVSPTAPFDATTRDILPKLDNLIMITDPDDIMNFDFMLSQIMEEQAKADLKDRKKILIVFDDCVGFFEKMPKLINLATRFRHFYLSIIIVGQSFRRIPLTIRNCSTCLTLFDLKSGKEWKKIDDEFVCVIPNGVEMIKKATREKYSFVYFNLQNQELYYKFEKRLWSKLEDQEGGVESESSSASSESSSESSSEEEED
jgi:hypothetical protein